MAFVTQAFQVAASEAPGVQKRGTRKERLELYALHQQATVGDNNTGELKCTRNDGL